jgi:hypothetical protein
MCAATCRARRRHPVTFAIEHRQKQMAARQRNVTRIAGTSIVLTVRGDLGWSGNAD